MVALAETKESLLSDIEIAERRAEQEADVSSTVRLSDCAWGPQEFEQFSLYWHSPNYSKKVVADRRAKAVLAAAPLTEQELVDLADHAVWEPAAAELHPWLKTIAYAREYFESCAIEVPGGPGDEPKGYFLIVFCRQQPLKVLISKLDRLQVAVPPPAQSNAGWALQFAQVDPRHRFTWHPHPQLHGFRIGHHRADRSQCVGWLAVH